MLLPKSELPGSFEQKHEFTFKSAYVGWTTGKRKTWAQDDSPTFVGPEVIQTATLSKSQAEENIRGLEVRYGCDLSKKRIESDLHKAAVVTNTIQRLEIELQMALMRQREYASKQALYNHVSSMRDLARVHFLNLFYRSFL